MQVSAPSVGWGGFSLKMLYNRAVEGVFYGDIHVIEAAFIGVLGRDGEIKTSSKGTRYVRLNLRVAEGDDAQWVATTSFDPDAIAQTERFVKGVKIYCE